MNGEERPQYLSRRRSDNNTQSATNGSPVMAELNGLASHRAAPRLTNTY